MCNKLFSKFYCFFCSSYFFLPPSLTHVEFTSRFGFLKQDYRYKSAACKITHYSGLAPPLCPDLTRERCLRDSDSYSSQHLWTLNINQIGLGGLGVPCTPRDPKFAGLNPAEVDGFFQDVKILSTSPPGRTLSGGSRIRDFKLVKNLKPEKIGL